MVLIPKGIESDAFNQESNPKGVSLQFDPESYNTTSVARGIFVKLMMFQQIERNLVLKHIKLLDQLFNIKYETAGLTLPLLKKLGELHVIIKQVVYSGKQDFLDGLMLSDNEEVKNLFQDDFFRQMMGMNKNRAEESEVIYSLLPRFLSTRNRCDIENEDDVKTFALEWLECLAEKYPNWLYQTVCSCGSKPLWIKDREICAETNPLAWCPENEPAPNGDFIQTICFNQLINELYDGEDIGDNEMKKVICDNKCFDFTLPELSIYKNLPSPLR